ncbi:hypothetical protein GLYMA_10G152600v4 [Glycine max]|uniref:Uncharacterized protein n=1 Tax=Glycine max TaxID=3847 RepID=A0A0R0HTF2_SOYBN|nr:hypothetical protein JHK85_028918 [Glycine max]KAG5004233.1 hypothetical protein JHK86_028372 [Glycine max]KAH1138358.1 hypothetical protein GYH30_028072 [Glycine max]KRH33901.1 hypothetical protein GLYMA_10G152600v4 [Glycine max]
MKFSNFCILVSFRTQGGGWRKRKTLRNSLVFLFDLFKIPSSGVTDFLGFADTPRNLITFPNVPDGYFGCNSSKMQL